MGKKKSMNKPIVIKAEKVVALIKGKSRRLTYLYCHGIQDLPHEYLDSEQRKPYMYMTTDNAMVINHVIHADTVNMNTYYNVGDVLTEDQFQEMLAGAKDAGNRLKDIRDKRKALRKEWYGEDTFII